MTKKKDDAKLIQTFVAESEAISGIAPFDPERRGTQRHLEIARILASAHAFVDPRLINGVLVNRHDGWLRTGTDANLRRVAPDPARMLTLFDALVEEAEQGIQDEARKSERVRAALAWRLHDEMICINPFKNANGRTARLFLNHVRALLRLPFYIVRYEESDEYYRHVEQYRNDVFQEVLSAA